MPHMELREEWKCLLREASLAPYAVGWMYIRNQPLQIKGCTFTYMSVCFSNIRGPQNGDYDYHHLPERYLT